MILLLVQKVEANARWIEERRSSVTYTPRNRAEVENFLKDVDWESTPLGAFVKSQRKMREEKATLLEEARREEEKRRAEEKDADKEDVTMGGFSEGDEGSDDAEDGEDASSDGEEEDEEEEEDEDEVEFEEEED